MLRVRPRDDPTNRYRTDIRLPYLSSDTMIMRERLIWRKYCKPPQKDSGQKKNKKLNSMNRTQKTPECSRCFFMVWGDL